MSKRTYIVTLRDKRDLANFYDEMEFSGSSNSFVPGREVKCRVRRNLSRNTHYNLTPEEAVELAKDPRVLAVELPFEDMGIILNPLDLILEMVLLVNQHLHILIINGVTCTVLGHNHKEERILGEETLRLM